MLEENEVVLDESEEQPTKKKFGSKLKEMAVSFGEDKIGKFEYNPREAVQNKIYLIQFVYNLIVTIVLLLISVYSFLSKYKVDGWCLKTIILLIVNVIYLLIIFIYIVIFNGKKKNSYRMGYYEAALAYTKFAMKSFKFIIPLTTLFLLLDSIKAQPTMLLYTSTFITFFTILSGFFGFIKAIIKLAKFVNSKDKRARKREKAQARNSRFDNFYSNARDKKMLKDNVKEIEEQPTDQE